MTMVAKESLKKNMKVFSEKLKRFPGLFWQTVWRVGRDDPRRVVHALKVGLSLTLVSLLYLLEPLFKGIGQNAIWAVMTVVVVLEFTAGQLIYLFDFLVAHALYQSFGYAFYYDYSKNHLFDSLFFLSFFLSFDDRSNLDQRT